MMIFRAAHFRASSLVLIILVCAMRVAAQDAVVGSTRKNNSGGDEGARVSVATTTARRQTSDVFDRKNEFAFIGGIAPEMRSIYGGGRRSTYGFVGARYSRLLKAGESLAFKYTVEFIPATWMKYDRRQVVSGGGGGGDALVTQFSDKTVFGVGFSPVGLQLNFRRKKKVQPFVSGNAGMIYFSDAVPDDRSPLFPERFGKRFNFTLASGGGVEFVGASGKSLTLGFKAQHISNASSGNINPGFDQNLFYIGYTFKKW